MPHPMPSRLQFPVEPYTVTGYSFGERVRRWGVWWATHLGDDVVLPAGTAVEVIGEGKVVLAQVFPGSAAHRSWGGLVVVGHSRNDQIPMTPPSHEATAGKVNGHSSLNDPAFAQGYGGQSQMTSVFYSLYGHVADLAVSGGETVHAGQRVGVIAAGNTPENGWWSTAHLHFAIYTGPWKGGALPGYWRPERWWRTRRSWWHAPQEFIASYNGASKLVNS